MAEVKDFFRLHPDEESYWSDELCFVRVPILGQKKDLLHIIDEDLAVKYLSSGKILRFRLALATKPHNAFFLCHLPTQNLDNSWNTRLSSRRLKRRSDSGPRLLSLKAAGKDYYKITHAEDADAFPDPTWPGEPLDVIIVNAFAERTIDRDDHPALLRLTGRKQGLS